MPIRKQLFDFCTQAVEAIGKHARFSGRDQDLQIATPQLTWKVIHASAWCYRRADRERVVIRVRSAQVSTIYTRSISTGCRCKSIRKNRAIPAVLGNCIFRQYGHAGAVIGGRELRQSVVPATISPSRSVPSSTIFVQASSPGDRSVRRSNASTRARPTDQGVPDTITGSFQGTAQAFQSSISGMGVLLALRYS